MPIITTPSGTVSPSEIIVSVPQGDNFSANISPSVGNKIAQYKQDGVITAMPPTGATVNINNVQQNHLLEVFEISDTAENAFYELAGASVSPTINKDLLSVSQNGSGTNYVESTKTYETASIGRVFCGENVNSLTLNFGGADATITSQTVNFDKDFTFNFSVLIAANDNLINTEFWLFANDLLLPTTGIKLIKIPNASNLLITYRLQFLINNSVILENNTTIANGVVNNVTLQRTNGKIKFAIGGVWGNEATNSNPFVMSGVFCFILNPTALNFGNYSISLKSIYDINTNFTFNNLVKDGIYLSYREAANMGTNCFAALNLSYFSSELSNNISFGIKRADNYTVLGKIKTDGNFAISNNNFASEITMIDTSGTGRLTAIMDTTGDIVFRTSDGNIFRASQNFAGFVKKIPSATNTHRYVLYDYTTATITNQTAQADYANYDKSLAPTLFKMVSDGVNDQIQMPYSTDLNFSSGDFTVAFFAKPYTTNATAVLATSTVSGNHYSAFMIFQFNNTLLLYMSSNGTTWGVVGNITIKTFTANELFHVVLRKSGNTIEVLINGNSTPVYSTTYTGTLYNNPNTPIYLLKSVQFNPFNGEMYNVFYYKRALTNQEINDLYTGINIPTGFIIQIPPVSKSDNIVDNLGTSGNGTLFGVIDYNLFYQTR